LLTLQRYGPIAQIHQKQQSKDGYALYHNREGIFTA
jgi:hypothetical protein